VAFYPPSSPHQTVALGSLETLTATPFSTP
jgi:hypothetical protein